MKHVFNDPNKAHVPRHWGLQNNRPTDADVEIASYVFDCLTPYQKALFTQIFLPHLTVGQRASAAYRYMEELDETN